jgi:FAD/FMN-containing dehydrogenase
MPTMSLTVPNAATKEKELQELRTLLATDEVIERDSPDFVHNSQPFATQKDLKPTLVVRPKTLDSLSRTVRFLGSSDLDFKVRSAGFGSASARDVILSMTAFDRFDFDQEKEQLILGSGQTWEDYYRKMEETAPAYSGS